MECVDSEPRLTFIGTGHVFNIGDAVRGAIGALKPDAVFIELDRGRFQGMLARHRGLETGHAKAGFIHTKLMKFQEDMAAQYGTEPGEEMLAAAFGARDVGAKMYLIDPPVEDTLRRALREMSWKERFRGLGMAAKGAFNGLRKNARDEVEDEIRRYQDDPAATMEQIAKDFPTVHRVVIAERDEKMAKAIREALPTIQHGVVVVGDGHLVGMLPRFADVPHVAYRLQDVRAGRLPQEIAAVGTAEEVGFGFTTQAGP